ncbi:hypothetical protein [Pseudomonas sp. LB3P31]
MAAKNMENYFSPTVIESAKKCAKRLIKSLPDQECIETNRVLLAYGGGKDSSYMVAWVRYIQGIILQEKGRTFQLRITTNRHAGMNDRVMENIDNVYHALGIYDDDLVECLITDGLIIRPFHRNLPMPDSVRCQNRTDVLMNGHRFQADARSTFCNACNLSMVNSFGMSAHYEGGVDVIITGDSSKEQTGYFAWARHLARLFDAPDVDKNKGFAGFLETLDGVAKGYFEKIYGVGNVSPAQRITHQLDRDPIFFNIYQDTSYESGEHWALLTDFMGFQFDELMFSFSESDCGNPTLMAHIRGLRAETRLNRSYSEGIKEYVNFALGLMVKKGFPPHLVEEMATRYEGEIAINEQRLRAEKFAIDAFCITNEQLICMIYSPFTQRGSNLADYIVQQQKDFSANSVHVLLQSDMRVDTPLSKRLEEASGLSLQELRQCYNNQLVTSLLSAKSDDPLSRILRYDPHKSVIQVRNSYSHETTSEIISGR